MTHANWPYGAVTYDSQIKAGWKPKPLNEFVLKVAERCNIACDYCYMYEGVDQSWKTRPRVMSDEVLVATARRIREHAHAHNMFQGVNLAIHGGEPLLRGREFLVRLSEIMHGELKDVGFAMIMQTNGILLTEDVAKTCSDLDIGVGVSLDGDKVANDRHRLYPNGRSSYERTVKALEILSRPEFKDIYRGVLTVIDLENDPIDVFDHLTSLKVPLTNFILPDATWESPPPRARTGQSEAPYGDWLIRLFDYWFHKPDVPGIRIFTDILGMLLGAPAATDAMGIAKIGIVTIDTDGSIDQLDLLKVAYEGAPETGLNVFDNSLDEVLRHPGVVARQIELEGLSEICKSCAVVSVCGGGYYPHRYRAESGFLNPSVYCADLYRLIRHINLVLHDAFAQGGIKAERPATHE